MFESLDFVYIPAPDIESSVDYYKNILGGELLWKIHAYGVWVACIVLSEEKLTSYWPITLRRTTLY